MIGSGALWWMLAAALATWLAGLWLAAREAIAASLAALLGLAGIPLGALLLGLSLALVSGAARDMLWPICTRVAASLPALAILLAPVLLGAGLLYEWTDMPANGFRGAWLAWPGFAVRGLAYLLLWWALACRVLPGSIVRPQRAGLALIALVLSVSLAAADWAMSVDAHFKSSIFGLLWLGRLMLSAVAFCLMLRLRLEPQRPGVLRGLLAAAALVWLYLHFMQYLIIWYGNLPEEVRWYQQRGTGVWLWLTWLLGAGQALVLFVLFWPVSQRRRVLATLCLATLVLGLVEGAWLAMPGLGDLHVWAAFALLVLAWLAGGAAIWRMQGRRTAR